MGAENKGDGAGAKFLIRSRRHEALASSWPRKVRFNQSLLELRFLSLKIKKAKRRSRGRRTGRPRSSLTRQDRGQALASEASGWRRGGSRHPRRVGVRAGGAEARPGAKCGPAVRAVAPPSRQRPAQSSGSVWRTGCPSATLRAPPLAAAAAAAPAARSRRVCAQHPSGRPRRWRRRGALGSRARPLRAALQRPAGRPGQPGSRPQALVAARAELGREASGSGHRPCAHPLYTIRTAAVPDPSRNESPKFQRQHKRASHFTAWPLIRATRAANTLLCQDEKRGWSLVGLWGEQEPTCTNAAASPRSSQLRVPAPRSRLRSQTHFDLRPSHPASLGRGLCPS